MQVSQNDPFKALDMHIGASMRIGNRVYKECDNSVTVHVYKKKYIYNSVNYVL